ALLAAEHSQLPSLVLDEADVGIGGQLTDDLAALLTRLGGSAQILMITHAPQIAALSQTHYRVIKSEDDAVSIVRLDEHERLEEISRMLGGAHLGESTLEYARTLLAGGQS
ncbi:MAG: DNA repair protein RecN, partial [Gammaproteobacteria bacterium]|nr:DNA repair protein RecN [Gammaproteobacteria bacterium]